MYTLDTINTGSKVVLSGIADRNLARRLKIIGVMPGCHLELFHEHVLDSSVVVRSEKGIAVLDAEMASKLMICHEDDHITPVVDMFPGENGHVYDLPAIYCLKRIMSVLGLSTGSQVFMVNRIPPFYYSIYVNSKDIRITQGLACRIWGSIRGRECQLALASEGDEFHVQDVLGGRRVKNVIDKLGIKQNKTARVNSLILFDGDIPLGEQLLILTTESGSRVHLNSRQASRMYVAPSG